MAAAIMLGVVVETHRNCFGRLQCGSVTMTYVSGYTDAVLLRLMQGCVGVSSGGPVRLIKMYVCCCK
jgi:hypothetical protein